MHSSRLRGALTAAALLSALPTHSQTPAAPAPSAAAPTLTPPGSTTPLPLVPGPTTQSATSPFPNVPPPPVPLNTPPFGGAGAYPGFSAPGLPGFGGGSGAGTDLSSVLSGTSSLPLSLTLGQLDKNWRRMTVTGTFDLGSVTQALNALLSSAGVGVYYTKGQTITVGEMTYLVAYRTQPQALNLTYLLQQFQNAQKTAAPPTAQVLTAQTPLALALLNLQTSGSLTDIRAFNLSRELADSAAAAHAYNSLMGSMGMGSPKPVPAHHTARRYPPA